MPLYLWPFIGLIWKACPEEVLCIASSERAELPGSARNLRRNRAPSLRASKGVAPLLTALGWEREEPTSRKGCSLQCTVIGWKKNCSRKLELEPICAHFQGWGPLTLQPLDQGCIFCFLSGPTTFKFLDTQHKMKARHSCSGIWMLWAGILWLHEAPEKACVCMCAHMCLCVCALVCVCTCVCTCET